MHGATGISKRVWPHSTVDGKEVKNKEYDALLSALSSFYNGFQPQFFWSESMTH